MPDVRYCEMLVKDRGRIAEDKEFIPVENPFLRPGEILHTEEAPAIPDGFRIDLRTRADDAAGIELQPDGVTIADDLAQPQRVERSISGRQLRPVFFLIVEQSGRKLGERALRGLWIEYGENLFFNQRSAAMESGKERWLISPE